MAPSVPLRAQPFSKVEGHVHAHSFPMVPAFAYTGTIQKLRLPGRRVCYCL